MRLRDFDFTMKGMFRNKHRYDNHIILNNLSTALHIGTAKIMKSVVLDREPYGLERLDDRFTKVSPSGSRRDNGFCTGTTKEIVNKRSVYWLFHKGGTNRCDCCGGVVLSNNVTLCSKCSNRVDIDAKTSEVLHRLDFVNDEFI